VLGQEVTLEDVGSVEGCLSSGASKGAEAADDGRLIVSGDKMSVTVITTCEPSLMKFARCNWAFFWSLNLAKVLVTRLGEVRYKNIPDASTCVPSDPYKACHNLGMGIGSCSTWSLRLSFQIGDSACQRSKT
jgi:hypothetical protein